MTGFVVVVFVVHGILPLYLVVRGDHDSVSWASKGAERGGTARRMLGLTGIDPRALMTWSCAWGLCVTLVKSSQEHCCERVTVVSEALLWSKSTSHLQSGYLSETLHHPLENSSVESMLTGNELTDSTRRESA